jgi:predicted transcriptional regulator YdeE
MVLTEKYFIDDDIEVACVKATSFPQGVGGAYHKLGATLPSSNNRTLYGISWGDKNGGIVYHAAASQLHPGEAKEYGLETFTIRKGEYISEYVEDWKKDETVIGRTFQNLLSDPHIDKEKGYCLEIYPNSKDVQCLVLLESSDKK